VGIVFILGGLAALGCLTVAFMFLRRKRLIDDIPTSKALGVFIGLAELKGTAESEAPLTSHLAKISCVHYTWTVEEHWSRTVTTTHTDAKGHTSTSTHQESGWNTVDKGGESAPFYLKDDTGIIRIVPEKAKIEDKEVFDKTCRRDDPLYFGQGPRNEIANSTHQRRFREEALPLHTSLYVMGQARERQDIVAAEIAHDKNAPVFLISTRTEKQVSTHYAIWFWFWLVLGLLTLEVGVLVSDLTAGRGWAVGGLDYLFAGVGFLLALLLGWAWTVFNSLVSLRQRVRQAWSQVDIQLKRRNDLIPNLVEVVEGYASHERETQEMVTRMRGQMSATPPGIKGPDYTGFIPALRVTMERYPELKSSELFLKLQKSLSDTEECIALARDYFNNIASFYNARLEIVPDRFVAAMAGFRQQSLMTAADFERAPVEVQLVT
jgi:hypothetical protein